MNLWRYDGTAWRGRAPHPEPLPERLHVVTYNVWFGDWHRDERIRALGDILENLRPDLIALQEATPRMLNPLLEREWVRRDYWCSAPPHGCVLLGRQEPSELHWELLPGVMGRGLAWADWGDFRVGTVHLESQRKNEPTRKLQLERVFERLDEASEALLMGDFNLCSTWEENSVLDPRYRDVWPLLREDPGWTEDSHVNTMRGTAGKRDTQVRFDRFLLRSERYRPESIERLGTEPIGRDLFPSDHFGLEMWLTRSPSLP